MRQRLYSVASASPEWKARRKSTLQGAPVLARRDTSLHSRQPCELLTHGIPLLPRQLLESVLLQRALAYLYVVSGLLLTVGNALFLPVAQSFQAAGALGHALCVASSAVYVLCSVVDLEEARSEGWALFDVALGMWFVAGTSLFLVGGIYFFDPSWVADKGGRVSYVAGTTMLLLGGSFNGVYISASSYLTAGAKGLAIASSFCSVIGLQLFLVATLLQHPAMQCVSWSNELATWLSVGGSALFTLSGVLPLIGVNLADEQRAVAERGATEESLLKAPKRWQATTFMSAWDRGRTWLSRRFTISGVSEGHGTPASSVRAPSAQTALLSDAPQQNHAPAFV